MRRPTRLESTRLFQPALTKVVARRILAAPFHSSRSGPPSNQSFGSDRSEPDPVSVLTRFLHANQSPPYPRKRLERCAATKLELLDPIKRTFRYRNRIVKAQRSERRCPDQANTHRTADDIAVVELQSGASSRCDGRTPGRRKTASHVRLVGERP